MDREELISKIKEMAGLSNDERAEIIGSLRKDKKYGLVWENHPEDIEELMRTHIPVLREDKDAAIISDAADAPCHSLIEGDNLEALTALTYTHQGKIDVIYIDPPYNTGNKDFVYNDSFVDSEDDYRHSKWLSFMEKRLRIAQQLLSDDGSIFISIDENELYSLKVLCDELFGEKNFIGQWNWFKSATPPALSLKVKRNLEYIIAYEKSRNSLKYKGIKKVSGSNDPLTKPQNTFKELTFPTGTLNVKCNDGVISAGTYGTAKFPNELLNDMVVKDSKNLNEVTFRNRFIWLQSTLEEQIQKGTSFDLSKQLVLSYKKSAYDPEVPPNLIDSSVNVETTEEAGKQLSEIIGAGKFDYPKPVSLIRYIINFRPTTTILDFFAGSGTTLHATMQLNAEDGGHRQCILVTNNENNICREVTYERNKRVIQGYTTPKGVDVEGLKNNTLRYYTIDEMSREKSHKARRELMMAMTDELCFKEGLFTEQEQFGNLPLAGKSGLLRFFSEGPKQMLLIYDIRVIPFIVKELQTMEVEEPIKVFVLCDGNYPFTADFEDVLQKVTLIAMPFAMTHSLKRVLPTEVVVTDNGDEDELSINDEND